jgi:histidyl-tRNA synthetase
MFRYERPQKGRYRQFYQVGVEVLGPEGPDVDAELLMLTARLWKRLGLNGLSLQLNSLGTSEARQRYRDELVRYLRTVYEHLDADSQRRLETNPLRILDSKNPQVRALLEAAPTLADYIDEHSRAHFIDLCALLDSAGLDYQVNPYLVRGLDYYGQTVFEWVTDQLGAQGTVCAGGRYNGLMAYLGGRATPAVGFALGLERIIALFDSQGVKLPDASPHLYLVMVGQQAQRAGFTLSEQLRDALPSLRLVTHCGGGSFKSQFKKADRSGARYALVLGEDEVHRREVGIKPLRERKEQETISFDALVGRLAGLFDF